MRPIYEFYEEQVSELLHEIVYKKYSIHVINKGGYFPWRVEIYFNNKLLPQEDQLFHEFKTYYAARNQVLNQFKDKILKEDFVARFKPKKEKQVCLCGKDKHNFFFHSYWCPKFEQL